MSKKGKSKELDVEPEVGPEAAKVIDSVEARSVIDGLGQKQVLAEWYGIRGETVAALYKYMQTRPYLEVGHLMNAFQALAQAHFTTEDLIQTGTVNNDGSVTLPTANGEDELGTMAQ